MHKKIGVDQLVVGMYLQGFEGSWVNNPFWRSNFLVKDPKDLVLLRNSKVAEVWIDTRKGLDVQSADNAMAATVPMPLHYEGDGPTSQPSGAGGVPIAAELMRAANICNQARQAVTSMFKEARMGRTVDSEGVNQLVEEISASLARNASALISLARIKTADSYTFMHSVAVSAMMIALARELGLDEQQVRSAGVAGLLHDLGKALVPSEVLNKPGKLTPAELAIVRGHPQLGYNLMLKGNGLDPTALDVCLHHHEKIDGTGYPKRLRGDDISLFARMGAVCDVYDAITSNRPYKTGWDPAESMRLMGQWVNEHFDPKVYQAFARSLGIFPVGSLVRLTSGRLGVVMEQCELAPTAPRVKIFFSVKDMQRIAPELMELSAPGCKERIVAREDPARWKFADLNTLWSELPDMG